MNPAPALNYGSRSGAKRRWLLRRWYLFLIGLVAVVSVVLWFYLPIWAPAIVIKYSLWDGPYCRAVLSPRGQFLVGDVEYLAAEKDIRIDRIYRQALTAPDAAVRYFALSTQLGLDGGAAEEYSSAVQSIAQRYTEDQLIAMLARLDPTASQHILHDLAFETGVFENATPDFGIFRASYPKLAARLQHELQP